MTRRDLLKGIFATAAYTAVSQVLPSIDGVRYPAKSTLTLETLISTTLKNYRKILADNITTKSPL